MSYPDQAPPRRPAAVVAAAAVLVLMAVGAGLYAVAGLLIMGGTTDRFRSAAATTGAGTGEIDGVVSLLRAAMILSAGVSVLIGLVLVGLALGLLAGRSGARVTTWVVCGLGLLCGCGALAVLVGQRAAPLRLGADQRVTADLLAQLGDAYPGWWIPVNAALSVGQVGAGRPAAPGRLDSAELRAGPQLRASAGLRPTLRAGPAVGPTGLRPARTGDARSARVGTAGADPTPRGPPVTTEPHPAVRRALVTGASLGIGASFAHRLAADGFDLILVARDAGRLEAMAAELTGRYGREVETISADLSTDDGCATVERRLADGSPVEMLVNNAGISLNTPFLRSTVADESRLLRLNVLAVMRLTHAALGPMIERGTGTVINVSSVAGFGVPMPGSTYSASKAWVTNFSESIGLSVAPLGVRVMALCPGYTRTGYHERAGIDMARTPGWMWLQADDVVDEGLRDLRKGKLVSVPTWKYKLAVAGLRHAPRRLLRGVSRDTRGRVGRGDG